MYHMDVMVGGLVVAVLMGRGLGVGGQVLSRLADFHEVIDRAMAASGYVAAAPKVSLSGECSSSSGTVVKAGLSRNESSFLDKLKSFNGVSIGSTLSFLNGESIPPGLDP